jgi:hypothetical protein
MNYSKQQQKNKHNIISNEDKQNNYSTKHNKKHEKGNDQMDAR